MFTDSRHPFRIAIVFIVLALIGAALVPRLNVNFTPTYVKPAITLTYNLPNSSPDIVERLATSPLENALSQLDGGVRCSRIGLTTRIDEV